MTPMAGFSEKIKQGMKQKLYARQVVEIPEGDIRKIQLLVLLMFFDFDRICQKYHLTYYFAGGSILGAVRHKGFIPWDDDIDITMPRDDYNRFLKVAPGELSPEFRLDKDCRPFCHNRIEIKDTLFHSFWRKGGVFLDILALEGSPDDPKKQKLHEKLTFIFRSLMLEKERIFPFFDPDEHKSPLRYLLCLMLKIVPRGLLKFCWNKAAQLYSPNKENHLVCLPASKYSYAEERFPKEYWGTPVYLEFEGMPVPTMTRWEDYLKCHFGDYRELPPPELRKSHHFVFGFHLGKYESMPVEELENTVNKQKEQYCSRFNNKNQ